MSFDKYGRFAPPITYRGDESRGIFKPGAKLQGFGNLVLQPPPPAGGLTAVTPWPRVLDTQARQGAHTFIDLSTIDDLPHVLTVSLGMPFRPPPPASSPNFAFFTECVAILDMGVGGITVQAEVDYVEGVQFNLSVARLQIHVVYRMIPGGVWIYDNTPAPLPTLQVGCSVASGTIVHGRQPQRTLMASTFLAANAYNYWLIPAFAKSLKVIPFPVNSTPTLRFSDFHNLAVLCNYAIATCPSDDLPIPNPAHVVGYQNTNADQRRHGLMVFDLAL